jgi:D-alanyl-lipoteichoic acid acyltransferase DltB (MBOAT superfamily)
VLFNSHIFLFGFLPLVLIGAAVCARAAPRSVSLLFVSAASLLFYAWWDWRALGLLGFSIAFNHAAAALLRRAARRQARARGVLLAVAVAVDLGLLASFKYANFFVAQMTAAFGWTWQLDSIALPLAISFFTFEQITYLVDAHHDRLPPHGPLEYVAFITFFPRLIAGPIVRPRELLPQLAAPRPIPVEAAGVATGLFIFAIGLCKKVVLADTFGPWVTPVFDAAPTVPAVDAWGATLAFTLYVYFDFSAYSDMAVGLARMFGIVLPENFDSPYQARSIREYWQRWHITLSTFLRDYVYVPLGGNRRGAGRALLNLWVTMLLGGLWHGANWTFVAWGAFHAALLTVERGWRRTGLRLPDAVAWGLTVVAIMISLVIFRAPSFERAGVVFRGLFGGGALAADAWEPVFGWHEWKRLLPALALVLWCPNRQAILAWPWRSDLAWAATFALLMTLAVLSLREPEPFLYFQF